MVSCVVTATNLANTNRIEYSAGIFVSRRELAINYTRCRNQLLFFHDV